MTLPTGTVTFLFTDIEGSTKLWEEHPEAMRQALAHHDALLQTAVESHNGHVFKTVGDAFCAAFAIAPDALAAALSAQRALTTEAWPAGLSLRVRMALHTGNAEEQNGDYFGPPLNRVARLLAIGHGGQVLLSQATRDLLPGDAPLTDKGSHRLKDLQQPEHVFQLAAPDLPSAFPPLRSLRNTNLPIQSTSFIGREREMAQLKELLASTRLLTLTGTGGCGKTRLALQVAAEVVEDYPDGVWLVELAALSDPSLVVQTVAAVLGLREEPGRSLTETLTDYLQSKSLLLLLDNCEHLVEACARLADTLLRSCPQLKILATSRETLNVASETTYRVPSLLQPDPDALPLAEKDMAAVLLDYDAVRLFVERARSHRSDFALTRQNGPAVAQVCHRLDGIPLALELAAARIRVLTAAQIASRLDDRFRLLIGGSRTALPRQQTLRATLDWSYDLLSEQERLLLGRLSVFAGGWTLEAAERVCAGEGIQEWEVLDLLTSLVDKSLAVFEEQEDQAEGRYRLLETIRQYGLKRLAEREEEAQLRVRHRDFFLALAEEAKEKLKGPEQAEWLERLEIEHDNLRAALDYCQEQEEGTEAGLSLAGALQRFWEARGYLSEGRERLVQALERAADSEPSKARAYALNGAGVLALRQGDYVAARSFHEQSLALRRELGNKQGIAASLGNLGIVAHIQGDYIAARAFFEESLAIARELGNTQGIANSLIWLGNIAHQQGDYAVARTLYEESLAIARELGDKQSIAFSLVNLGIVARVQGNYTAARTLYEESLGIQRELGDKGGIATSLVNLGPLLCKQGDYLAARRFLAECLTICHQLGEKRTTAYTLQAFAELAHAQHQPERAVRLSGAAQALREAIGAPLPPSERAEHDRIQADLRAALGEDGYQADLEAGRSLLLEQAIAYALTE
ncbi:MAG TPA: tetratricopeptide repeat protein [Chthonomonadaceae bacterium]|nr:tetratricopeptide repeat protein [Chthonomonadaceae bacterium]